MRTIGRWATVAALALGACGGGDDRGADAGRRDAGAPADGGGGAGALTVHVYRVIGGAAEDGDGVAVAFAGASGPRQEATAGADGRVTFEGVDWSAGPGTVVAWAEGHVLTALTNLGPPAAEVPLYLLPLGAPAETVTLSGTATGMLDPTHLLIVTSTTGGFHQGTGPAFRMDVPAGEGGTLVALELTQGTAGFARGDAYTFHQATTAAFDAPTGPAGATVDFAAAATLSEVSGTLPVPSSARASSALNTGDLFLRVSGGDVAGALLGLASRMDDGAAPGTVDYDITYLALEGVTEPTVAFFVSDLPAQSGVFVDGWPSAGAQAVTFLDAPTVTTPEFGVDHPWTGTVRWETADGDSSTLLQAFDRDTGFLRAVTIVMPGRSSASLPQPPSAVTLADALGGAEVDGRVVHCDPAGAPDPWTCQRFSRSRAFGLVP